MGTSTREGATATTMARSRPTVMISAAIATVAALVVVVVLVVRSHDSAPKAVSSSSGATTSLNPIDTATTTTTTLAPRSSTISAEGEERGITYANPPSGPLTLDVTYPALDGTPLPAIIVVHGGGWRQGSLANMAPI